MNSLLDALSAATGCLTDRRLSVWPRAALLSTDSSMIAFGPVADLVPLRAKAGGSSGLLLDVNHWFRIETGGGADAAGDRHARTVAYQYRLTDRTERELLVFHWQPGPTFRGPDFPHLHVSASLSAHVSPAVSQRLALDKRHVPTGLVTLADVVRMLIAEFGVAERQRDWPRRLARIDPVLRRSLPGWP